MAVFKNAFDVFYAGDSLQLGMQSFDIRWDRAPVLSMQPGGAEQAYL
jgi:hypothetical protein